MRWSCVRILRPGPGVTSRQDIRGLDLAPAVGKLHRVRLNAEEYRRASGEKFSGPQGLKDLLMSRSDEFARATVERLLTYALGRELDALLLREVEDGGDAEGAVQVDVKIGLRELLERLERYLLCHG